LRDKRVPASHPIVTPPDFRVLRYRGMSSCIREPSRAELVADATIHAIGITLAIIGAGALVAIAVERATIAETVPILIYAAALLAMLGCSAAYHLCRTHPRRPFLQRLDHAAIFAMIAGTYTPFTVMSLTGFWSWGLTSAVWTCAAFGMIAKLRCWRCPEKLWTPLYLALAWLIVVALEPLSHSVAESTMTLIIAGGLLYTTGVIFHEWQRLKFQNALWHAFVLLAAGLHYAAVVSVVMA